MPDVRPLLAATSFMLMSILAALRECRSRRDFEAVLVTLAACAVAAWDRHHHRAPVFALSLRLHSFLCLGIVDWFPW